MIHFYKIYSYLVLVIRYSRHVISLTTMALLSSCYSARYSHIPNLDVNLEYMNHTELLHITDKLGMMYKSKPKNKTIGIAYSDALRMVGKSSQALAVMRQIAILYPQDMDVLASYGKNLADAGYLDDALNAIERAQRPDMPDWKLISAKASILAQMGRYLEANIEYNKALELAPNESSIVSNMGISYLLSGDIKKAEEKLRYASKMLGSDSRIRQNLALVVGLQGRIQEAYSIAAQELSPEEAEENIAYLKSVLSQKDPWATLRTKEQKPRIKNKPANVANKK
ncbi:MAG: hypothetical protein C4617_03060 [Candidatus Liberibacter europaeus]|uniref:Uncharacterized protein n=1 Tax=Candidatus Liberibacter europaeus TaxID=744859 RepID=A0A2T4VYD7_9HYPH|nr:hypothetical protein [Candidatus Liberibacter europaeus]PTL86792.1 MAG: hypothetical protein C4617_03060 [Candidatus Liberibacter europaeus]